VDRVDANLERTLDPGAQSCADVEALDVVGIELMPRPFDGD